MITRQAKIYTALQYFIDLLLTSGSLVAAYYLRLYLHQVLPRTWTPWLAHDLYPLSHYTGLLLLIMPIWLALISSMNFYHTLVRLSIVGQLRMLANLELFGGILLGFALFLLKMNVSRPLILLFLWANFALLFLERVALKIKLHLFKENQHNFKSILIVAGNTDGREVGELIKNYRDWGLHLAGYITTETDIRSEGCALPQRPSDPPTLGGLNRIPQILQENIIDEIVFVASDKKDLEKFEEIFPLCETQGIRMRLVANFFPQSISRMSMGYLDHVPLITFSTAPDYSPALVMKRLLDLGLSLVLLAAAAPLMLVVAALLKLTTKGPIIYRQVRCGLYGRPLTLYKFRSMIDGAEDVLWEIKHLNEMDGPVFKMRQDPRVAPLGRVLRKSSIDELPQLYNVLKGDMSLVGPRAPLPEEVREYTRSQRRRLSVTPGITCLWQVSGRNEIDFNEWMKMDLRYIDNWSLLLDLKILLKTILTVLLDKGAR
ncbi:MAG: sugar transferase [Acidobacteria bacterium]|nr:sugar transferase [Acidobacteriota bacterium]MBI3656779.1 sugar transferase [Acidobacteriota bacterium]